MYCSRTHFELSDLSAISFDKLCRKHIGAMLNAISVTLLLKQQQLSLATHCFGKSLDLSCLNFKWHLLLEASKNLFCSNIKRWFLTLCQNCQRLKWQRKRWNDHHRQEEDNVPTHLVCFAHCSQAWVSRTFADWYDMISKFELTLGMLSWS